MMSVCSVQFNYFSNMYIINATLISLWMEFFYFELKTTLYFFRDKIIILLISMSYNTDIYNYN